MSDVQVEILENKVEVEIKNYIIGGSGSGHTHSNKALLDTYTQTNADLADAVAKKHAHTNLALLETYTQTEANLADAVTKKHSHSNKTVLDAIQEALTSALKTAYDSAWTWVSTNGANVLLHIASQSNPHNVTANHIGLQNVDNTSDADKPISTATQAALDDKVGNNTDSFTGTAKVTQIVTLSQAEYDGLTPDANTLYIII